jgi:AcrR family transcriptional regulator
MTATGATARPLRVDAARNRARILAAATEVFAERGLDVTLDDIAAHAGLGVGTVYRRFADREALVDALFNERMQAKIERMQTALAAPAEEAADALIAILRYTCEEFAGDRGLRQVMLSTIYGHGQMARCRDEVREIFEELVKRAKATGRLRADFDTSDVPMLFLMISSIADFGDSIAPDLWERYFDALIDGLCMRPDCRSDAPASVDLTAAEGGLRRPALTTDEVLSAMACWRPASVR